MADKRSGKRKIKRMHITFTCEGKEYRGISSNFSDTGLYIKTRKKCKPGAPVEMILEIEDTKKIPLKGVIARTRITSKFDRFQNGIGVELTDVPPAYRELIEVLLKKQQ